MTSNERHNPMTDDSIEVCDPAEDVKIGLGEFPAPPEEDATDSISFDRLPPLPPSDLHELEELTRTSSQPEHCDEGDWELYLPPAPIPYKDCVGTVTYSVFDCPHQDRSTTTSRQDVITTLSATTILLKHLTSNLSLLESHTEAGLAQPSPGLEPSQYKFAQPHCAITETLKFVAARFGLPDAEDCRASRNFFQP